MKFTSGLPETACGKGSTLEVTENVRAQLPALLKRCGIKRLVDAPCGDGNWIAETDLSGIAYHGIDFFVEHLQKAIARRHRPAFEPTRRRYELADIFSVRLPAADAILCREFFQHISNQQILDLLEKFRLSGISWLLATSFDCDINEEVGPDRFRPVNLQDPKFGLGPLAMWIDDPPGSGRFLGLWQL